VTVAVTATSCPASAKTIGINPVTGLDATALVSLGNDTASGNGSSPTSVLVDPLAEAKPKDSGAGGVAASAVLLLAAAAAQVLLA
jgi:hypothetical protein